MTTTILCLDCGKPVGHTYSYARCYACHRALPSGEAGRQQSRERLALHLGVQATDERSLVKEWARQVREGRVYAETDLL